MKKLTHPRAMKRKHDEPGPSSLKCTFCDLTFIDDEKRQKHIKIAHKNKVMQEVRGILYRMSEFIIIIVVLGV